MGRPVASQIVPKAIGLGPRLSPSLAHSHPEHTPKKKENLSRLDKTRRQWQQHQEGGDGARSATSEDEWGGFGVD
jgi:hypothetical protein